MVSAKLVGVILNRMKKGIMVTIIVIIIEMAITEMMKEKQKGLAFKIAEVILENQRREVMSGLESF